MPIEQTNYIREYYNGIKDGSFVVGELIRKIYDILISGIDSGIYIFDYKKANKAIKFIETFCRHCEGSNGLFILELWQKALVSSIFGIVDSEGYRQFREVFIVIARKNGKSILASAIIAYMSYMDGEYGAQVYCIAPKLKLANIVYGNFYQMISQDEELGDKNFTKHRKDDIYIPESNTTIQKIAFSSKKSDGFNPHLVVADEIAAWEGDKGLKQYDVMKSAFGSRSQPLLLSISTSGYIDDSAYDELIKRSTAFLNGTSDELRLLPFLYIIDDIEKCFEKNELLKSNPNMNVSVSFERFYVEEIKIAKNSLPKRAEFLTKYCNIKQNNSTAWLNIEDINKSCKGDYSLSDFVGCYCVGGVDLSQTTDLSSACVVIEKNGKLHSFTKFFMPKKRLMLAIAEDNAPYDQFIKTGVLQISGDNFIDYHDITAWFVMLLKEYKIKPLQIGYDRYSARYFVEEMKDKHFHMDDVYQGENLTSIMNDFDGILKDGNFLIADKDKRLLKTHLMHVAVKHNPETRRFKPVKLERKARIDGFIANICAMTVRSKWYSKYGNLLKNNKQEGGE